MLTVPRWGHLDQPDGYRRAVDDGSGVLTPDNAGYVAAVHAFACAQPGCSITSGAAVSGFAANGNAPPDKIPEPATFALLGTTLVGIVGVRRR